ncbi:uncharacterized protein BO80DRAFT_93062 [Aspergillus ibericus CBS 121593]|uniref:Uncharacterized protein n=1 Tax=Aspergillus ibericus CBS 121593 TaxID=1448316 RepID=A0A395H305_9EURO|nr:hypothetical protein BO80DRAFT_93062 [Aspergillus ibericus CBS 121593]RAL00614.1 hypothetical protein BO80DRAFT_93062 [Aspergillus ibericus CBS 121593]
MTFVGRIPLLRDSNLHSNPCSHWARTCWSNPLRSDETVHERVQQALALHPRTTNGYVRHCSLIIPIVPLRPLGFFLFLFFIFLIHFLFLSVLSFLLLVSHTLLLDT